MGELGSVAGFERRLGCWGQGSAGCQGHPWVSAWAASGAWGVPPIVGGLGEGQDLGRETPSPVPPTEEYTALGQGRVG